MESETNISDACNKEVVSSDVLSSAFSSDEAREQLKQAILECTREEVTRALNQLILPSIITPTETNQCNIDDCNDSSSLYHRRPRSRKQKRPSSSSGKIETNHMHRSSSAPHLHKSRTIPHNNKIYLSSQRPKSSSSRSFLKRPSTSYSTPLDLPINPSIGYTINRSSSNLLEKSAVIVTKATGRRLEKYENAFKNEDPSRYSSNPLSSTKAPHKRDKNGSSSEDQFDGIQRVDSWPQHAFLSPQPTRNSLVRPTTTSRMLYSSNSVLRPKPARPSTTSALERRKPPTSTAASERAKAEQFSKRLLGPIAIESQRPNYHTVVPHSLHENEWETELARNIINVFSNKVRSEMKGESCTIPELPSAGAYNKYDVDRSTVVEGNESTNRSFTHKEPIPPSIVKTNSGSFSHILEHKSLPRQKESASKKGSHQNGALRLKMIWFTGTGMVRANWDALNGKMRMIYNWNSHIYYSIYPTNKLSKRLLLHSNARSEKR